VLNKAAESVIDSVLEDIVGALKDGDRVNISGFGTFAVLARVARTGRNPQTGESIEIPSSRTAKFKPGKQLKESLSGAAGGGGVLRQSARMKRVAAGDYLYAKIARD